MEIAAYPVPYFSPLFPQNSGGQPVRGINTGLPAKQSGTDTPEDRVLQGEVLNDGKRKPNAESASSRYTFEQQTRSSRPDLSGLNTSSRKAIQSYLDNEDLGSPFFSARPLIDEYV